MKFRKKPIVIEAERVSLLLPNARCAWAELPEWIRRAYEKGDVVFGRESIHIRTLEGSMRADLEDWVICGVKGELYPCKSDIFAATYEAVGDAL